ncbi:MAG: circadian clock KaiB family protein [Balneolaceae bacterium]
MNNFAEQQESNPQNHHYTFTLFVIKSGANSERAKENLENHCDKWLQGRYDIKVVDVVEDFQTALKHNILLTPSVLVTGSGLKKVIHGDLSDSRKFAEALNLYNEKDE